MVLLRAQKVDVLLLVLLHSNIVDTTPSAVPLAGTDMVQTAQEMCKYWTNTLAHPLGCMAASRAGVNKHALPFISTSQSRKLKNRVARQLYLTQCCALVVRRQQELLRCICQWQDLALRHIWAKIRHSQLPLRYVDVQHGAAVIPHRQIKIQPVKRELLGTSLRAVEYVDAIAFNASKSGLLQRCAARIVFAAQACGLCGLRAAGGLLDKC